MSLQDVDHCLQHCLSVIPFMRSFLHMLTARGRCARKIKLDISSDMLCEARASSGETPWPTTLVKGITPGASACTTVANTSSASKISAATIAPASASSIADGSPKHGNAKSRSMSSLPARARADEASVSDLHAMRTSSSGCKLQNSALTTAQYSLLHGLNFCPRALSRRMQ